MHLQTPNKQTLRWLAVISVITALFVIINPITSLDALLIITLFFIIGHIFLQEKLILVFLIIRPTLDFWRDITLFQYENTTINLNAALSILLFGWLVITLVKYRQAIPRVPFYLILAIFCLLIGASSIYSISPLTTIIESIKFYNLALLFVVSYILIKKEIIKPSEFLKAFIIGAIIPLTLGLWQMISGAGITTFEIRGRIYGTFAHPNIFAFFALFLLFFHTQYSTIQPTKFWQTNKELKFIAYFILILLLAMTYTRAGLIGLAIFLIIIGIFKYRKLLFGLILATSLFYLLFFPINSWLVNNTTYNLQKISIINRITARNEDADSLEWRRALIRETAPIIKTKMWLGYGYGTFPYVWEQNRSSQHLFDDSAEAHNDYLRLALEIGLIGLGIYLIFLLKLSLISFKTILKKSNRNDNLYFFAWVMTFVALSVSDNMIHHTPVMWMMWSWWGVVFAMMKNRDKSPNLLSN